MNRHAGSVVASDERAPLPARARAEERYRYGDYEQRPDIHSAITVQPESPQVQVAPDLHLIVQPPPAHAPMVQTSPGLQSSEHWPPTQLSMVSVEPSVPVSPTAIVGPMEQPGPLHSPMWQVRPG
jgi:hypothetical protein